VMMNNSTGTKKNQTKSKAKKAEDGKRVRTPREKPQTPQTPPSLDSRTFIRYTPPQSPVRHSDDDELMAVGSGTIIQYTPPQSPVRNDVDDIELIEESPRREESHVSVAKPFRERVKPPPAIDTQQLSSNISIVNSTEESDHLQRTPVESRGTPFPVSSDSAISPVGDPWLGWTHVATEAKSSSSPPHPFGSDGPFGAGADNIKSEQSKKRKESMNAPSSPKIKSKNSSPVNPTKISVKKKAQQQTTEKKLRSSKPTGTKKKPSIGESKKDTAQGSPRGEIKPKEKTKKKTRKSSSSSSSSSSSTRPRAEAKIEDDNGENKETKKGKS